VYPIVHDRYGIPDAPRLPHVITAGPGAGLVEFPMTTARVFGRNLPAGGGGYLRLLPFAYNRWALRRASREGPCVVYVHPWELDPYQPRFALPVLQRVRAYHGLVAMERRFDAVLRALPFAPMRDVIADLGLFDRAATVIAARGTTQSDPEATA
jgi:hypothetical protein